MAIAGLARQVSGYAMAIVLVALDAHGMMAIIKAARNAIRHRARQQHRRLAALATLDAGLQRLHLERGLADQ